MTPFVKMDGLYFDATDEPDETYFEMLKIIEDKMKKSGKTFIKCDFESADDYYNMLDVLTKFTNDNLSVCGTSRTDYYEIVLNEYADMDDTTKPSTVGLRKKKKHVEETEKTNES